MNFPISMISMFSIQKNTWEITELNEGLDNRDVGSPRTKWRFKLEHHRTNGENDGENDDGKGNPRTIHGHHLG